MGLSVVSRFYILVFLIKVPSPESVQILRGLSRHSHIFMYAVLGEVYVSIWRDNVFFSNLIHIWSPLLCFSRGHGLMSVFVILLSFVLLIQFYVLFSFCLLNYIIMCVCMYVCKLFRELARSCLVALFLRALFSLFSFLLSFLSLHPLPLPISLLFLLLSPFSKGPFSEFYFE